LGRRVAAHEWCEEIANPDRERREYRDELGRGDVRST
jgi:hypothetical protein